MTNNLKAGDVVVIEDIKKLVKSPEQVKREEAEKKVDEPLTKDDLIDIGFEEIPHFTIAKSMIYNLDRNRQLTIGSVGTPNEVMFVCELSNETPIKITDLVCLHNYDYDGYLTKEKLTGLINSIGRLAKSPEQVKQKAVKNPIDNVTVENLSAALKYFGYQTDPKMLDLIIDLVELLENKGSDTTINELVTLELERMGALTA